MSEAFDADGLLGEAAMAGRAAENMEPTVSAAVKEIEARYFKSVTPSLSTSLSPVNVAVATRFPFV